MSTATATKERPILFSGPMVRAILDGRKTQTRRIVKDESKAKRDIDGIYWGCPYGLIGDRLWVRETWFDNLCPRTPADGLNEVYYRADGEAHEQFPGDYMDMRWTPSIHMPRWASRITLEVTGVRVERLNEIDADDVFAEGALTTDYEWWHVDLMVRQQFQILWESINGPGSWAANPWVWVIEFKRVKP